MSLDQPLQPVREQDMPIDRVLQQIVRICKDFSAEKVYLYGSRAKGVNLERSDIDIAVSGVSDFESMSDSMEEIETLFTIDLLNLDAIRNQDLLEDIALYGRKIYEKI